MICQNVFLTLKILASDVYKNEFNKGLQYTYNLCTQNLSFKEKIAKYMKILVIIM